MLDSRALSHPVLDVRNLAVQFNTEDKQVSAVNGISFQVERGKTLGIVGESGSGKSVTSLAMLGLIPPPGRITAGEIWFNDGVSAPVDLRSLPNAQLRRYRGGQISMIFQEPMSALNPVYTIGYQIIEAIRQHQKVSPGEAEAQAIARLQEVKLLPDENTLRELTIAELQQTGETLHKRVIVHAMQQRKKALLNRYPHQLSGGQLQRVTIAMAIACNPTLLIADEPTTALDVTVQATILSLLRELREKHQMSMMFITHDLGVIAEVADYVAVMYRGEIVEMNTVAQIFANPQHPYTKGLIACRPQLARRLRYLPTVSDFMETVVSATGEVSIVERQPSIGTLTPFTEDTSRQLARIRSILEDGSDPIALPDSTFNAMSESKSELVSEDAIEPSGESTTEPVTSGFGESTMELVTVDNNLTGSITSIETHANQANGVTSSVVNPDLAAVSHPVAPIAEPAAESIPEPIAEPAAEPVVEPVATPARLDERLNEGVNERLSERLSELANQPIAKDLEDDRFNLDNFDLTLPAPDTLNNLPIDPASNPASPSPIAPAVQRETSEPIAPLDSSPDTRSSALPATLPSAPPSNTPLTDLEVAQRLAYLQRQPPLLEVKNLQVGFPVRGLWGRTRRYAMAVNGVSFQVFPGETLGLVGESGCGKTTLSRTLLRLIEPIGGEIRFDDRDILQLKPQALRNLRRDLQIIFQDPFSSLNPRLSVGAAILEPMHIHNFGNTKEERFDRMRYLLDRVGLDSRWANRYPHEFSGGQRQRICIARALALNPKFVICDESVSALDVSVQAQVLNLLKELQDEFGLTYIFISHDLSVVKFMSDRIMVMNQGEIEEIGPADRIYREPQREYTRKLIDSIPQGFVLSA